MNGPLSGFVRVAEDLRELGPVRDPHRRVDRTARGQPDERGDRGADALDGLVRGWDLLDVDARGQVRGHSLLHSWSVTIAVLSSLRSPPTVDATQARRAAPGSSTSITASSRAQRITLVSGETACDPLAQLARLRPLSRSSTTTSGCRPPAALDDAAPGRRSCPITSTPSSLEHARHADGHDRAEVPEQDARRRASLGPRSDKPPDHAASRQGAEGSRSGSLACPSVIPLARRALRAGAPSPYEIDAAARHLDRAARLLAVAVRAITRCAPGGIAVEAEAARRGRSTAQRPASGRATHASATGSPSASRTTPPMRVQLGHRARGPSESRVRSVCVRTSGPRTKRSAGLDREL